MPSKKIFKKGEVYWAGLETNRITKGGETQKNRPVVIISNDKQNQFSTVVIVALLTTQVDKVYSFEVLVKMDSKRGKILTDQIYTVDKSRLGKKIGILTEPEIKSVEKGLHIVFDLKD